MLLFFEWDLLDFNFTRSSLMATFLLFNVCSFFFLFFFCLFLFSLIFAFRQCRACLRFDASSRRYIMTHMLTVKTTKLLAKEISYFNFNFCVKKDR